MNMSRFAKRLIRQKFLARSERGQSLVEMTLGFVILLLVASGLLDLGRLYFVYVALEDGAGEAATYLAINPACAYATDGANCADPSNAEFRASTAGGHLVDWSDATVTITRPDPYAQGDEIGVQIAYPFKLLTPVIPDIAGANTITLTADAKSVVLPSS